MRSTPLVFRACTFTIQSCLHPLFFVSYFKGLASGVASLTCFLNELISNGPVSNISKQSFFLCHPRPVPFLLLSDLDGCILGSACLEGELDRFH